MSVSISEIKSFPDLKDLPLNKISKIIAVSNLLRCSKINSASKEDSLIKVDFKIDYVGSGLKNYHGNANQKGSNESLERTLLKVPDISDIKIDIPSNSVQVTIKI